MVKNKKLLLYRPNKNNLTGSVYKLQSKPEHLKRILKDCFDFDCTFKTTLKMCKTKYKKGRHGQAIIKITAVYGSVYR